MMNSVHLRAPSNGEVFRKCCKSCCEYLGEDLRQYFRENKSEFVFGVVALAWLISSSVLFGTAEVFGSPSLWTAFGIVSFGIPAVVITSALLITVILYAYSCFRRTQVDISNDINPSLFESWRV